ncbi:MAG: hypothetical protein RLZZ74_1797 [Cyanobacteriota bacterium]|jgi:hypothetical protein
MKYFFYPLLGLGCFLFTSSVALAGGSTNAQKAHQYPADFLQGYNQECMQTSMEEGLEEAEAKRLCNCTIKEFQRQYSLTEFKQLTAASATDKASEATLIEVGQSCFEQILYEE